MDETVMTEPLIDSGDEDLREELSKRYDRCEDFYSGWDDKAEEDYKFALGDQWTKEELEQLATQKRPALAFNRIKPLIGVISGYHRQNSARVKVTPEGGEDQQFSEVMDKVLTAVDKWSKWTYKEAYQFDDGLICGKGFLEAIIDYTNDPVFGELRWAIVNPRNVYVDPGCTDYDLNESAEYIIKFGRYSRSRLKSMFPAKKKLIDGFTVDSDDLKDNLNAVLSGADDYGRNSDTKTTTIKDEDENTQDEYKEDVKFTLKEYWYKRYKDKWFCLDPESGEPVKHDTKKEAEEFSQGSRKIFKRTTTEMYVASMVCGQIMQDEKSPFEPFYSGFPLFRYLSDWTPSAPSEELRVMGIVRSLIDPQKEKNKAKSQYLHILNTQTHSGWIGDTEALTDEGWKKLEAMGSVPGIVIRKQKSGSELVEIQPKMPSMANLQREQLADNEFKEISNVNPDLLGLKEDTASGKAISLRIKQAVISLERYFYNFRYTKEIMGKFVLKVIPMLFDEKKIMKILGQQYMQSAGMSDGNIMGFLKIIKDSKYDVQVSEQGFGATQRMELFEQLTSMAQAGMPIPPDMLIEYMDIPNKQEVQGRVMQYVQQQQAAQAQPKPG